MNERNTSQKQNLSGLSVLLLFGVFAVCIFSVLIAGTRVYDRLTKRDEAAYAARTASQYLRTRIRQAERADAVTVTVEDGMTVLHIAERRENEAYETRLFCRDGWLCEQFIAADAGIDFESGEKILPADALEGGMNGGLLTLHITDAGGTQTVCAALRGGEELP